MTNSNGFVFQVFNSAILFGVTTSLFAIIFRVLPDATIRWRDSFIGACFTSFLFLIGKYLIGFYLANSTMAANFGGAASMVIILLWVYYSSNILFFGAEFTKIYAMQYGGGIVPDETAVFIIKHESKEINVASVPISLPRVK